MISPCHAMPILTSSLGSTIAMTTAAAANQDVLGGPVGGHGSKARGTKHKPSSTPIKPLLSRGNTNNRPRAAARPLTANQQDTERRAHTQPQPSSERVAPPCSLSCLAGCLALRPLFCFYAAAWPYRTQRLMGANEFRILRSVGLWRDFGLLDLQLQRCLAGGCLMLDA